MFLENNACSNHSMIFNVKYNYDNMSYQKQYDINCSTYIYTGVWL